MKQQTQVVIIGAGIAGSSVAYHLTRLGWTDIVVVDQGPLPKTGGSTLHAPESRSGIPPWSDSSDDFCPARKIQRSPMMAQKGILERLSEGTIGKG